MSFNEYKKMQMLSERHRNKRLTSMVNKLSVMLKNRRVYEYNAICPNT
jgi:hypothetical protein